LSAGPYRPITLRTYINHLASITTHARVSGDLKFSFALDISLSSANGSNIQDGTLKVHVTLRNSKGAVVKEEWVKIHSVEAGTEIKDFIDWILEKDAVALWWPVGYGDQVLYEVEIILMDAKVTALIYFTVATIDRVLQTLVVIDTVKRKIGFRHVELAQRPLVDAPGTSFFFKVNGVPMFMGGESFDIPLSSADLQNGFQGLTGYQRILSSPR
jgi:beta-mannosidase